MEWALARKCYINQRNYNISILWSFFIPVYNVRQRPVLEVCKEEIRNAVMTFYGKTSLKKALSQLLTL